MTKEQIKDIADNLSMGLVCYVHKKTKAIISVPDPNGDFDQEEGFEDEIKEVKKNSKNYVETEKMGSRESFQVMEAFAEQMEDKAFQSRLIKALNRPKTFHNFKYEIDDSEYREQWFEFKALKEYEWVEELLKLENLL
jgi:Uncharacterised protein family (UPF0158)